MPSRRTKSLADRRTPTAPTLMQALSAVISKACAARGDPPGNDQRLIHDAAALNALQRVELLAHFRRELARCTAPRCADVGPPAEPRNQGTCT